MPPLQVRSIRGRLAFSVPLRPLTSGQIAVTVLLPLLLARVAGPLAAAVGTLRPRASVPLAVAPAGPTGAATLWVWSQGGGTISAPWSPTWGLTLTFTLDGLATLYALLATGIGAAVLVYAARHVPLHVHHQHRPEADETRFHALILPSMGATVGLVLSQDLILIFVFWDVTAIASYHLIGHDRRRQESHESALLALLVTGIAAVLMLPAS